MKAIKYPIKHQYQPTNTSCSPTALAILLSYYDKNKSWLPEEIGKSVSQVKNEKGEDTGTINTQLATWSISRGFNVSLYTFDVQIIDQSWAKLSSSEIIKRLEAAKRGVNIPSLDVNSNTYRQSYVDYLRAGGELIIQPCVTTKLLYNLLENGPILPCVCDNTLYGKGRTRRDGTETILPDDVNGLATNHSVVIYGCDKAGNFLIADPWYEPGFHKIDPERMLCAISTAQIECDNLLFQLTSKA